MLDGSPAQYCPCYTDSESLTPLKQRSGQQSHSVLLGSGPMYGILYSNLSILVCS